MNPIPQTKLLDELPEEIIEKGAAGILPMMKSLLNFDIQDVHDRCSDP